jgi:hypothetical protein
MGNVKRLISEGNVMRKEKRDHVLPPKPEILQLLLPDECKELRKHAEHLLEPDRDRALLLTAHLVTERLLEAMLETALKHPDVWIDDADYRSKVNLACAMGLIGDEELAICRVLNSARNAMAHALEPLPEKWKVELKRLAFGSQRKRNGQKKDMAITLKALINRINAPWLYARYKHKRQKLWEQQHAERWQKIMRRKLREKPELLTLDVHDPIFQAVAEEVDLELAKEWRGSTE